MKKIFALVFAVLLTFGCTVAAFAADPTYPSPTAPTVIPPGPDEPETVTGQPTPYPPTPSGSTSPSGSSPTSPTGPSTPTKPGDSTKPGDTTRPGEGVSTTPDGSTVTGTAKPDVSPESPKTGDTSAEVFVFAALAMTGAAAAVLLNRKKDDAQ